MKTNNNSIRSICAGIILILTGISTSAQVLPPPDRFGTQEEDKTLSPYFFVQSDDPETDRLPLKETRADVNIAGVIADVTITQVYKNEGTNTLEAIYVFPASTRAAVYAMKMSIGEREILAIIQEKEKARQQYIQAKEEGKTASLLEQHRPNVFQMNVANILPGDIIKVEMKYTELLIPEMGVYEFVYPTVVGPRYSNTPMENVTADEAWVANPYTTEGIQPFYTFDIKARIAAGLPIHNVRSSSHNVDVKYSGKTVAEIRLNSEDSNKGNKDFILQYRLAGNQIESGLLLFEGNEENFFLAMIQPPKNVTERDIPPREYVFIVDVSGSMSGFPLQVSKKLLKNLIGKLGSGDRFNVLFFAGGSNLFSERSVPATQDNISKALAMLDNQRGGGGTELIRALNRALALPGTEEYSRSFIIATDGYVSVEKETFDLIRNNLGRANFFSFGIGSSVNRYIIEGIAHVGMGLPFIITNEAEAGKKAEQFRKYIESPVLTNIKVSYEGFDVYDVEPLSVPDVLAERPVIVYGKWKGNLKGRIILEGLTGNESYRQVFDVSESRPDVKNSGLKYLWARERIRLLDDYTQVAHGDIKHAEKITALGLKYNLLTQYTSFIAIDSEIRNEGGQMTSVKQPLPLPEGVSNYAVGGISTSTAQKGMYSNRKIKSGLPAQDGPGRTAYETRAEDELSLPAPIEKMPLFTGGADALKKFIQGKINYPETLMGKKITGRVFVQFDVDTDGSVINIKVIRGIHPLLDKEAIRVIKLTSGLWSPAEQGGKPVKVQMVLPVEFK